MLDLMQGKTNIGNERVMHHYAGALNAVPLLKHYQQHPDQLYILRIAMAGLMDSVANIKPQGGASMGFHGDPSILRLDGYSADWGIGFFGHCSQVSHLFNHASMTPHVKQSNACQRNDLMKL